MAALAKKRFGQHFLRDTGVLNRIVRLIRPMPEDVIIEIGAGEGALSSRLAPVASKLLALEVDADCLPVLERSLSSCQGARVVHGDVLALDLAELARDHLQPHNRLRVVGTLPYNIATPIIQKLLRAAFPVLDMIFMVQLEVAKRLVAEPGSRDFGLLTVLCQHLAEIQMAFKVSPACFVPKPKVMSAVVRLVPLRERGRSTEFEAAFIELAKAAFSHRRKTLANSLGLHPALEAESAGLLAAAGIDGSRRPEAISVKEYEHMASTRLLLNKVKPAYYGNPETADDCAAPAHEKSN